MTRSTPSRLGAALRGSYLIVLAIYFLLPLLAMARFAFQSIPTALLTPQTLFSEWSLAGLGQALSDDGIRAAAWTSLQLALLAILLNLALLLPLAIVVEIRSPNLRPLLSGVTLLPWLIPPIALVVGVAATFRVAAPWFLASPLSLVPFYALWAMPFAYRALDNGLVAIHARTLVEAGRSLGASLPVIIGRILLPNLRASMVAASGLTAAMVLGEFAFASLLLKTTLPTQMLNYQRGDPRGGLALALFVLVATTLLLAIVVRSLRRRGLELDSTGL